MNTLHVILKNKVNLTPPLTPKFNKQNNTKCTTCGRLYHKAESCRTKILKNLEIPYISEYKWRNFIVFYEAKVGGSTYIWLCVLQKKITS